MSKELRHIHLSSGLVVAIMAADVISLARKSVIYDCTDGHDLHIDPDVDVDVDGVEMLLTSVMKANQVIAQPAAIISATVSGHDWAGEARKMMEKIAEGRAFGTGGILSPGAAASINKAGGDAIVPKRAYIKGLLKEALREHATAHAKLEEISMKTIDDIRSQAGMTEGDFETVMAEVAGNFVAEKVVGKIADVIKKNFGAGE